MSTDQPESEQPKLTYSQTWNEAKECAAASKQRVQHPLKTWPVHWDAIYDGRKTFELRRNDRNFQTGDQLLLNWYDPETDEYDGSWIEADVTYVLRGPAFGLMDGWVIMGIEVTKQIISQNE